MAHRTGILTFIISLCVFQLNAQNYSSLVNASIPDDGCFTDSTRLNDTIDLRFEDLGILDLDIVLDSMCLNITHSFVGDVDVFLYLGSLDGPSIEITTDNGFRGMNYEGTCFADNADTAITAGTPPYRGTYIPEQNFSNFNGLSADTLWILSVCDDEGGFTGTFDEWSINFGPPPPCPPVEIISIDRNKPDTVKFSWIPRPADSIYLLYLDSTGLDPLTTNPISTTDTFYFLINGPETEVWDFYVRTICKMGDTSALSPASTFLIPYDNDFCSGAIFVPTGDCDQSGVTIDNILATDEGFPAPSCETLDNEERDLWYTFIASDTVLNFRILFGEAPSGHVVIYDSCAVSNEIYCQEGLQRGDNIITGLQKDSAYNLRFYTEIVQTGIFDVCFTAPPSCFLPDNFGAVNRYPQGATIIWDSTFPTQQYLVQVVPAGHAPIDTAYIAVADTFFNFQGGEPNTAYDFYLQSVCMPGDSSFVSFPFTFYTTPINDECEGAISLDSVVNLNDTCVDSYFHLYNPLAASFSSSAGAPGASCADGDSIPRDIWFTSTGPANKVLEWRFLQNPGFTSIVEAYTGNCTSGLKALEPENCTNAVFRLFEGLPPGDTIYYRVWDFDSDDPGAFDICITIDSCPAPFALNASDETFESARLSWADIPFADSYLLYVGFDGFEPVPGEGVSVPDSLSIFSGADPETMYDYYVQSVCANGDTSAFSRVSDFTTLPFCVNTSEVFVDSVSDSSALLSWRPVDNISEYLISIGEEGFDPDTAQRIALTDTMYSFQNGQSDTRYDLYIASVCTNDDTTALLGPLTFSTNCTDLLGDIPQSPIPVASFPFSDINSTDSCYDNQFAQNTSSDVFYRLSTGSNTDSLVISTCNTGTNYDTYLALLDSSLTQVLVENDDAVSRCNLTLNGENLFSTIVFDADTNSTYYLVVEGFQDNEGTYELTIDEIRLCPDILNLTGPLSTNSFEASQLIRLDGNVPPGADVILSAPNVELQSGAIIDGELLTTPDGCSP